MKQTVIFVVTNGAGLGHLTRGLAVAKRMRELNSELEVIFVSTSLALEVIRQEDFMFYYIPTRSLMPEVVTSSVWTAYMKDQLRMIVRIYNPIALVFDGSYPYGGVISNLRLIDKMKSFWIKREGYKDENKMERIEKMENYFDYVIIPKEAGKNYDMEDNRWYSEPIIMLDDQEAHPRNELRQKWKIGDEIQMVYVQLGAGNINDINSEVVDVIDGILENPNYKVLLGESIIGKNLNIKDERVSIVKSYPNSKYFLGIDYAVSAAGYNSYHELMHFGVPTLFIPNKQTVKDGQEARAMLAQEAGAALCMSDVSKEKVKEAMSYMFNHKEEMSIKAKALIKANGAKQVAEYIINSILN